MSECWWHHS